MTEDQFRMLSASLIRHLLTLAAGWLVARGYTGSADAVSSYAAAAAVFGSAIAWSFIQKHKLLEQLCGALDLSTLEQVLLQAAQLRKNGADPVLISHMIGTAAVIAGSELAAARPDLVPPNAAAVSAPLPMEPPPATATPAPAPESPSSAQEPGSSGVTADA